MARAPAWMLLAISCLISLIFFDCPGSGDVRAYWLPWVEKIGRVGLIPSYALAESDYPPLSFAALYLTHLLSPSLGAFAALKVTIFGFQLLSTAMILLMLRNVWLAVAFNTAVMLSGISLGYIDIFFAPTVIGAVWALRANRPLLSAFLLGVTCLIKW